MALIKAQLIDSIHNQVGLPEPKSAQEIGYLLDIIKRTLGNGEDILTSGFGEFCVKEKGKRRVRKNNFLSHRKHL
jgi:integration host factor subunit alpha